MPASTIEGIIRGIIKIDNRLFLARKYVCIALIVTDKALLEMTKASRANNILPNSSKSSPNIKAVTGIETKQDTIVQISRARNLVEVIVKGSETHNKKSIDPSSKSLDMIEDEKFSVAIGMYISKKRTPNSFISR
jgi:hypothetical protein